MVEWDKLTETELKDARCLVNAFGRYLKKECGYSADEARFAKGVIDDPYGYERVHKQYEMTRIVCGKGYEVYFCSINDCEVEKHFRFYMLVDVSTINSELDGLRSHILAKKKYVLVK